MIWCIYRYIFLLNTLSGVKSCLVAPGVAISPWAIETVLSPWLAADEGRVSHLLSHCMMKIYIYTYCYAAMCPAGLQGAVHSCQVHQLMQGTDVGCGLPMLFNVTDITNSVAESHFKITRWVIGELSKIYTANWLALPLKYKVFDKYNASATTKRTLNCCVWVNKINNNLLNKRKKQRKSNSGKSQERERLSVSQKSLH